MEKRKRSSTSQNAINPNSQNPYSPTAHMYDGKMPQLDPADTLKPFQMNWGDIESQVSSVPSYDASNAQDNQPISLDSKETRNVRITPTLERIQKTAQASRTGVDEQYGVPSYLKIETSEKQKENLSGSTNQFRGVQRKRSIVHKSKDVEQQPSVIVDEPERPTIVRTADEPVLKPDRKTCSVYPKEGTLQEELKQQENSNTRRRRAGAPQYTEAQSKKSTDGFVPLIFVQPDGSRCQVCPAAEDNAAQPAHESANGTDHINAINRRIVISKSPIENRRTPTKTKETASRANEHRNRSEFFQEYLEDQTKDSALPGERTTKNEKANQQNGVSQPVRFSADDAHREWMLPDTNSLASLYQTPGENHPVPKPAKRDAGTTFFLPIMEEEEPAASVSVPEPDDEERFLEPISAANEQVPNFAVKQGKNGAEFSSVDQYFEQHTEEIQEEYEPEKDTQNPIQSSHVLQSAPKVKKWHKYVKLILGITSILLISLLLNIGNTLIRTINTSKASLNSFQYDNAGEQMQVIRLSESQLNQPLRVTQRPDATVPPIAENTQVAPEEEQFRSKPADYEDKTSQRAELMEFRSKILTTDEHDVPNADVKGWITIPGIITEAPLLQGKNNSYYANRDEHKKENQTAGTIFIESECDLNYPPENLIVYGSIFSQGKCFEPLLAFTGAFVAGEAEGLRFANQNKLAEVLLPYEREQFYLVGIKIMKRADMSLIPWTFKSDDEMKEYLRWFFSNTEGATHVLDSNLLCTDRLMTLVGINTADPVIALLYRMRRPDEYWQDIYMIPEQISPQY